MEQGQPPALIFVDNGKGGAGHPALIAQPPGKAPGEGGLSHPQISPVGHHRSGDEMLRQTAAQLGIRNLFAVKANAFLYLKACTKRFDLIFSDAPLRSGGERAGD